MTHIKDNILNIVKNDKATMIPKWKFVLYSILGIFSLVFALLALVFLASLVTFLLATSGFVYMPMFGLKETMHFLISVPIFLFAVAVIMLFVTEMLARQHAFAFKKPILVTLLSITALSVVVGFFVAKTPLHFMIRDYARMHHISMMQGVYERPLPFAPVDGMTVIKGIVLATTSDTIQVRLFDNRIVLVRATGTFPLPLFVEEGVGIAIFGVTNDGEIFEAFKVKPLGEGRGAGMMRNGEGYGKGMMREINSTPLE
jgi:hypothetical protein